MRKIASTAAACAMVAGFSALQATEAAAAPSAVLDCSYSVSDGGRTGNATCRSTHLSRFRVKVTCRSNSGSMFTVLGDWQQTGTSSGTCSFNGTSGVSSVTHVEGIKG